MKPIKNQPDEDFQVIFTLNGKMYVLKDDEVSCILPCEVEFYSGNRFIYAEMDESGYVCPWYIDISSEDLENLMEGVKSLETEYKIGKFPDEKGRIHFFDMADPNHRDGYEECIKLSNEDVSNLAYIEEEEPFDEEAYDYYTNNEIPVTCEEDMWHNLEVRHRKLQEKRA